METGRGPVRLSPPAKVGTEIGSQMDPASVSGVAATLGTRVSTRRSARGTLKNGSEQAQSGSPLRCKKHRNPDFQLHFPPPRPLKLPNFPLPSAKTPMPGPLALASAPSVPPVPDGKTSRRHAKILSRLFLQEIFKRNHQQAANTE